MLVAIATTKAEVLANEGLWSMINDSRTDWAYNNSSKDLTGRFFEVKLENIQ